MKDVTRASIDLRLCNCGKGIPELTRIGEGVTNGAKINCSACGKSISIPDSTMNAITHWNVMNGDRIDEI
jgi:hypothetical protein